MKTPDIREPSRGPVNAMTVDVEDYSRSLLSRGTSAARIGIASMARGRNTERVLALFDAYGARATFSCWGGSQARYPQLVRRIDAGHELASHGYARAHAATPAQFREDVRYAKKLLEDISGSRVRGYRAASYSMGRATSGRWTELHGRGTSTAPASTPSVMTCTACPGLRASPSGHGAIMGCWKYR
jgi:peptidoglycan/xylan/chitin deacetylase (PgdA/CDA1 family)